MIGVAYDRPQLAYLPKSDRAFTGLVGLRVDTQKSLRCRLGDYRPYFRLN